MPASGDDVVLSNNAINIDTTLDQSAVSLNSLTIDNTYTGYLGTTSAYLQVGSTLSTIGRPSLSGTAGAGSPRLKINFGSVAGTVSIVNSFSGTAVDTGLPPIRLLGTGSNGCIVSGGNVAWAVSASETSKVTTLSVTGGTVYMGAGTTLTTVNANSGATTLNSALATLNQSGGSVTTQGTGTLGVANVAGSFIPNSTGTISTLNVSGSKGKADFSQSAALRTVTNLNLYAGAQLNLDNGRPSSITRTNGIVLQQCAIADVTLNLGRNITIS